VDGKHFIVAGSTFYDSIFYGLDGFPELGTEVFAADHDSTVGGMAITALGLQALVSRVTYCTSLGRDVFGTIAADQLKQGGVDLYALDTTNHKTSQTVAAVYGGDRAFLTILGGEYSTRDLVRSLQRDRQFFLDNGHHLHIGIADSTSWQLIQEAASQGSSTSVSLSHQSLEPLRTGEVPLMELLDTVDFVLCNEAEAEAATGMAAAQALAILNERRAVSVITCGQRGALFLTDIGTPIRVTALDGIAAIDTTGAGDSFAAGFLGAWAQGRTLAECAAAASVCGSLSTTAVGGTAGFPRSMGEIDSYRDQIEFLEEASAT